MRSFMVSHTVAYDISNQKKWEKQLIKESMKAMRKWKHTNQKAVIQKKTPANSKLGQIRLTNMQISFTAEIKIYCEVYFPFLFTVK